MQKILHANHELNAWSGKRTHAGSTLIISNVSADDCYLRIAYANRVDQFNKKTGRDVALEAEPVFLKLIEVLPEIRKLKQIFFNKHNYGLMVPEDFDIVQAIFSLLKNNTNENT